MHADRITDSICYHAEGPHWSDTWGGLRWVDMLAGDIMQLSAEGASAGGAGSDGASTGGSAGSDGASTGGSAGSDGASTGVSAGTDHAVARIATPSPVVACVRPASSGGAVLAIEKGFALEDADGSIEQLPPLWEENVRMNEGAIAPDGSFLCGSMHYDQAEGAAAMWRLMPDGTTTRILTGITVSNGLAFTADGARAYYVDTPTGRVDLFDWDDRAGLVQRRTFADLNEQDGHPDGLCLDAEGNVWVAMNGGSQVLGLDSDGSVTERITVGARQVTACTFGGADRSTLFITTSRENLEDGEDPQAGSLFAVQVGGGVRGSAEERLFGG